MIADECVHLFDNLKTLLEKQIETARKGNFNYVDELALQADAIVKKVIKTKKLHEPEFQNQKKDILKLYKKLQLILAAGKDSLGRELKQVGNVRKTLNAYRNNG